MSGYKTTLMYGPLGNQLLLFPVDCDTHKFFAAFRVTFLMMRVCFKPIMWYIEMHYVSTFFSVWRHGFFLLRDVHSQCVYLQEESLPPFLSCRMHLNNCSEFCPDSSMAYKTTVSSLLEDKHVVNEHYVIRKSHDTTQKKMSSPGAFHRTT